MPLEHVDVARGAVGVGGEGVEPHDVGGEGTVRRRWHQRVPGDRPRQVVERVVEALARSQQVADLVVGLQATE